MSMTLNQLHQNRNIWYDREHFRYARWRYYYQHHNKPKHSENLGYRHKWWSSYIEAREKRRWYDHEIIRHTPRPSSHEGYSTFDGHSVANWIIPSLVYERDHGYWHGYVVSGVRSASSQWAAAVNYARQLGRSLYSVYPSGPLASNHVGYVWPRGAVDVTNYNELFFALRNHPVPNTKRLVWAGNTIGDYVHFSSNGR